MVIGPLATRGQGQPPVQPPDDAPSGVSPEMQELIKGTTLAPDPGEPAGAIRAYIDAEKKVGDAMKQTRFGVDPAEPSKPHNPDKPLDEALTVMRDATAQYPTSRHAWMGLGNVYWFRYASRHKAEDLRESLQAYMRAIEVSLPLPSGGTRERDAGHLARRIAKALVVLKDRATLDRFFQNLKAADTEIWQIGMVYYAQALSALKDPRADELYQLLWAATDITQPGAILYSSYIEYLYDQGRYREVLELLGKVSPSELTNPISIKRFHLLKGATLERLGQFDDAKKEYRGYLDQLATIKQVAPSWFPADERFRIPGSDLQQGIDFGRSPDELPEPEAGLGGWFKRWFGPALVWADHLQRQPPCTPTDWFCRARHYLVWTMDGETGCVNTSPYCIGTTGGQRADAWNVRTRVFYGWTYRICFGTTQTCTNYAPGAPLQGTTVDDVARRYYYVIDTGGYGGQAFGQYTAEAELNAAQVALWGSVPDPMVGACLAGTMYGGPNGSCDGTCSVQAGYLNSFLARQSGIEFRAGRVVWNCPYGCCREELMPDPYTTLPSGSACSLPCFSQVIPGAICPKWGWLSSGCPSTYPNPYWGPRWGNFYWRFYGQ